jgi:hypothetical protein
MVNAAAEAALGGTPKLRTFLQPIRQAHLVLTAWAYRGLLILVGLLLLVVPGLWRWSELSFMPLVVCRGATRSPRLARAYSQKLAEGACGRLFLLRAVGAVVLGPITDIIVATALHQSPSAGVAAVCATRLLFAPLWLASLGVAYVHLVESLRQHRPKAVEWLER